MNWIQVTVRWFGKTIMLKIIKIRVLTSYITMCIISAISQISDCSNRVTNIPDYTGLSDHSRSTIRV